MQLTLFYSKTCPYSGKVLNFLRENHIEIPLKDKNADPQYLEELIRIGGKKQVPCLIIDGKALYESDDIIEWLKENYRK